MRGAIESQQVPPVACTLALTELGTQVERWAKLYADAGTERVETDDGLRVSFRRSSAVEHELRDLVTVEVECCAWADWKIEDAAQNLTLSITSEADGVDVIRTWLVQEPRQGAGAQCPAPGDTRQRTSDPITKEFHSCIRI